VFPIALSPFSGNSSRLPFLLFLLKLSVRGTHNNPKPKISLSPSAFLLSPALWIPARLCSDAFGPGAEDPPREGAEIFTARHQNLACVRSKIRVSGDHLHCPQDTRVPCGVPCPRSSLRPQPARSPCVKRVATASPHQNLSFSIPSDFSGMLVAALLLYLYLRAPSRTTRAKGYRKLN